MNLPAAYSFKFTNDVNVNTKMKTDESRDTKIISLFVNVACKKNIGSLQSILIISKVIQYHHNSKYGLIVTDQITQPFLSIGQN